MKVVDKNNFELARELKAGSKIHVCKNSYGWLPLFQAQEYLWESIEEIKRHYDVLSPKIVNEYGGVLTWEEFERNVINWNGGYDGVIPKTLYKSRKSTKYWLADSLMPKYLPVSHFTYADGKLAHMYFKDLEGYEFTWLEFS